MRPALVIFLSSTLLACGSRALTISNDGSVLVTSIPDGQFIRSPDSGPAPDSYSALKPDGEVTVTTDKASYFTGEKVIGTVHNGTQQSIYLPGCSIFNREYLAQSQWVNKGATITCEWEGEAVEVKPGGTHSQETWLYEPGNWRLTLDYGTGCQGSKPLSEANCTGQSKAVSETAVAAVDIATCEKLNKKFKKYLEQAKQCDSTVNTPQCTITIESDLNCGCPIWVNDISKLLSKNFPQIWGEWGCDKLFPICDPCDLPPPFSCKNGTCQL